MVMLAEAGADCASAAALPRRALHWDNAALPGELVIRPCGHGWQWSGSFAIPDKEEYFGLRLRNGVTKESKIIPVNTTVGRSGMVLVTLKAQDSIPPYRIHNRCKGVVVHLKQAEWWPR